MSATNDSTDPLIGTSDSAFKLCSACGVTKPRTAEFWSKCKRASDGIQVCCKACCAAYYAANRDKAKASQAAYRVANRDRANARNAAYYATHHDERTAYRAAHRDEKAAYNADHRDERAAYHAAHPEAGRAKSQRRRALKLALPVNWTAADLQRAIAYWGDCCAYCDCPLPQLKLFGASGTHFDHYVALADPRRPHPGTTRQNMLPTCAACNLAKHDSDPVEWLTGKFGARKAKKIVARIEDYFISLSNYEKGTNILLNP